MSRSLYRTTTRFFIFCFLQSRCLIWVSGNCFWIWVVVGKVFGGGVDTHGVFVKVPLLFFLGLTCRGWWGGLACFLVVVVLL